MEYTIMGIALAFNILVVMWKLRHDRVLDGIIDGSLLVLVAIIFSGSTAALIIGTIGSALVSIYLLISPIKLQPLRVPS